MEPKLGKVYLVGAGPGDPGLLTVRGAECLRRADVVLYDYLATPELLIHTRPDAEFNCLGRHGHGRLMSQTETSDLMIRHAKQGRTVVRLKGGDPAIFARLAEELAALEAANISYEIVPGVTAASAASSHAGIPLTDRDEASCVAFVTGHERQDKEIRDTLDYAALARFPGTLVFYMGITTAPHWSRELIANGKSPSTPITIVRRCTWPDQQSFTTTLGDLPNLLAEMKLRPPAVLIVGDVARQRSPQNWFNTRPLFGRTVLVTRPVHQADVLANRLRELGANVVYQPAIEISPLADWSAVDRIIGRLEEFQWLVFSSANGVQHFLDRLFATGNDVRTLAKVRLAAIGPATVESLAQYHLRADVCPDYYRAEALAEALASPTRGQRVLLLRASRGREVLAEMLTTSGATVEQVVVYESRDIPTPDQQIANSMAAGEIDITTVTSSAIARSLFHMFGTSLAKTQLAAISSLTAEVLSELGYAPAIVAETYTSDGLVDAILTAAANGAKP